MAALGSPPPQSAIPELEDLDRRASRGKAFAMTSNVLFIVGGAAVAAGVGLMVADLVGGKKDGGAGEMDDADAEPMDPGVTARPSLGFVGDAPTLGMEVTW